MSVDDILGAGFMDDADSDGDSVNLVFSFPFYLIY
jgi:hypothetical protein